jgi:hypothetical protein
MEAILLHQKVSKKEAKEKTIALFKIVQLPRPRGDFRFVSAPNIRWAEAAGDDCHGHELQSEYSDC